MNVSRRFIDYPVMTTLVMAAIVIFGLVGYFTLPVNELPNVDFPTISVQANLPGADPETMASAVAAPLENVFTTVPGIDSMTSTSSQGNTQIILQFKLDRNIDAAAQDVQAAMSSAMRQLPKTMIDPPTFKKENPAEQPILFLSLSSKTLPMTMVDRYAETLLARQLSTLNGVAQVNVFGAAKYAVRIQADPAALAARGIGIDQLAQAVQRANANQATGALNGIDDAAIIHTDGQLQNAAAFRRQIIAYRNGAPVRVGDVANVIDSISNLRDGNWYRGEPAINVAIMRQPGSNTIEVIDEIKATLPRFEASLPAGIDMQIRYDRSVTIRSSIDDVQKSLLIAGALVVGVIFLFLRRASATIIPSLALPIAVIGTFAGMSVLGYSLDNLSLMALTLSVGFVVDDAIVVLENIVRHMEMGKKPYRGRDRRLGRDRLHDPVDDGVARGRVHPDRVHERHRRPAVARVRGHDRDRGARLGRRLGHAHADAVRAFPARRAGLKQNAFHRASERAFLWLQGSTTEPCAGASSTSRSSWGCSSRASSRPSGCS